LPSFASHLLSLLLSLFLATAGSVRGAVFLAIAVVWFCLFAGAVTIPTVIQNGQLICNRFWPDMLQLLSPVAAVHSSQDEHLLEPCWLPLPSFASHLLLICYHCCFERFCHCRIRHKSCLSCHCCGLVFVFFVGAVTIPTAIRNGQLICNRFRHVTLQLLLPVAAVYSSQDKHLQEPCWLPLPSFASCLLSLLLSLFLAICRIHCRSRLSRCCCGLFFVFLQEPSQYLLRYKMAD